MRTIECFDRRAEEEDEEEEDGNANGIELNYQEVITD
jgi:hypothetical protein